MLPTRYALAGLAGAVASGLASAIVYSELPARMVVRFGAGGRPAGLATRPLAAFALPGLAVGVVALFAIVPRLGSLDREGAVSERRRGLSAVTTVGILVYVHGLVLAWNLGYRYEPGRVLVPVVAVAGLAFGHLIQGVERNRLLGIRTPWTLSDRSVWARTNRFGGTLFKLAGVLSLGAVAAPGRALSLALAPIAAAALASTVYSYVLHRRERAA